MTEKETFTNTGWKLDNSYALLPKLFFSRQDPTPVRSPKVIIFNRTLANTLGLDIRHLEGTEGAVVFAGNQIPEGSVPLAQAYAGHQFGHFTMLGDGRALLLGEQLTPEGGRVDIQLKGSGRTQYSRGGDGRAALGPMLREYIISEAMSALGIPTTRSLAVTATGEPVYRETVQPGAVLTRVAASHIRVGTFQYASRWGTAEELRALAEYTIKRHCPEAEEDENPYLALLREVVKRQAALIAKWQLAGFIHGVMNTDNMALSGETIDYGPCAFIDAYDPATVFSSIDVHGRYAYGNQPGIAQWNLKKFAETLLPVMVQNREAVLQVNEALADFNQLFYDRWLAGMRAKLGIFHEEQQDGDLIGNLLEMMKTHRADFTNTFRAFTLEKPEDTALSGTEEFRLWHNRWQARLGRQRESKDDSLRLMKENNPAVIPRNHRVEEALEAAVKKEDFSVIERLLDILSDPFAYSPGQEEYASLPESKGCPYRTFCGT
ncbi:MAG: YdiU family protein [Eubacteriales bacterium]|nr:YdiU family protein [Eubacteriales bacterium]